jgi:hypothetical protein
MTVDMNCAAQMEKERRKCKMLLSNPEGTRPLRRLNIGKGG